jgi:anti-sigma B factor antagonist
MQTTTFQHGDERRVGLSGRMTADRHDEELPVLARRVIGQGALRIVLDLRDVSYMDSTCLGELIEACQTARELGAELHVTNVPPRVQRLLDISGVTALIHA